MRLHGGSMESPVPPQDDVSLSASSASPPHGVASSFRPWSLGPHRPFRMLDGALDGAWNNPVVLSPLPLEPDVLHLASSTVVDLAHFLKWVKSCSSSQTFALSKEDPAERLPPGSRVSAPWVRESLPLSRGEQQKSRGSPL